MHAKFISAAEEKLKTGPVPVPFLVVPRFEQIKWKVVRVNGEVVSLESIGTVAPGLPKKLSDLPPKDQYEMYLTFLPKPASADENKAFAAFCAERGLTTEMQAHELKAGQ